MSLSEMDSWKNSLLVLIIISIIIGTIQRTQYRFLDPIFEFCIFHISTITALMIYLQQRVRR